MHFPHDFGQKFEISSNLLLDLDCNVIVWRTPKERLRGRVTKIRHFKGDLRDLSKESAKAKYLTFINHLIEKGEKWWFDERLRTSAWEATGRKVIRIDEMIPKEKICFDLLTNYLNQFFKKCMEASLENLYVDRGA